MVESVPTAANVESYAKIVLEKFMLRELIRASHELSKDAYNDRQEVGEILDTAEQTILVSLKIAYAAVLNLLMVFYTKLLRIWITLHQILVP